MTGPDDRSAGHTGKPVAARERRARVVKESGRPADHSQSHDGKSDRLPPGQRLVTNWPVLDLGVQPEISVADWSLCVDGLVDRPFTWTWADFCAAPQVETVSDIHCVTAWSRYDNQWAGVSAATLLNAAQPQTGVTHVLFHSFDGYTANVTLPVFSAANVVLASHWQGQPLARSHGGPVRVVIPDFYFWKSAKWLKRIEFLAQDQPGFWEERGYHNIGDPWSEQRYDW